MPAIGPGRDALVTEALIGVLEIAWDGEPGASRDTLRERTRGMPPARKEEVLHDLIRLDDVASLLQTAAAGRLTPTGIARELEPWQDSLVARALEPLSELVGVPRAREIVDALPPLLRAEILLRSVNAGPPGALQ